MKNRRKVIKTLFFKDIFVGMCFWSLIIYLFIPLFKLPPSLAMVLSIFFVAVMVICFPFSLYKRGRALHFAKNGVEVATTNISIEPWYFGRRVTFEYEYGGKRYNKVKYFHSIFFPHKDKMKLLLDTMDPSKYVILEFRTKSVVSLVRERNS